MSEIMINHKNGGGFGILMSDDQIFITQYMDRDESITLVMETDDLKRIAEIVEGLRGDES